MMDAEPLASILDGTAEVCRLAEPGEWTPEDMDRVLRGLNTVTYEVVGLSARIRAARAAKADPPQKVNDTKPGNPVKPLKSDPPPPPPPDENGGD